MRLPEPHILTGKRPFQVEKFNLTLGGLFSYVSETRVCTFSKKFFIQIFFECFTNCLCKYFFNGELNMENVLVHKNFKNICNIRYPYIRLRLRRNESLIIVNFTVNKNHNFFSS